jgi:rubrerythrin
MTPPKPTELPAAVIKTLIYQKLKGRIYICEKCGTMVRKGQDCRNCKPYHW